MAHGDLVALAVVFMVIPLVLVFLRFWARAIGKAGYGIDDILILPALLLVLGMFLAQLLGKSYDQRFQQSFATRLTKNCL